MYSKVSFKRPCVKTHVANTKNKGSASCIGGYCEIPQKPSINVRQFFSQGEGVAPPLRKELKECYKLSYPDKQIVPPETHGPLMVLWIGRRWYSSP